MSTLEVCNLLIHLMDILWMLCIYSKWGSMNEAHCAISNTLLYYFSYSYSVQFVGNIDTYSWHRSDPWVVSADPWEATGAENHGPGQQQHSCDAGRVVPCLQNRVLNSTWLPGSHLYSQMVRYSLNCSLLNLFLTSHGLKQHMLYIGVKPQT